MSFLRKLFGLCQHQYVNERTIGRFSNFTGNQTGLLIVDRCSKCGKIKITEI